MRPTHMSGQPICNSSWKRPESSVKDLFYCTRSARTISSTDTTMSVSSAAHVSCCWSPENCWTCSVTRSCMKPFRDSFLLRAEWWRCFAAWPRTTRWRPTSRTGRGGEKSPPRTRLMSTSRPFWRLSLTVCKIYYTYTFILIALKEQVTLKKKKNVNIHSRHKHLLSSAVKQSCVSPLYSQSCRLVFNLRRSVSSTTHHVFTCNLKAGATAPPTDFIAQ